MGLLSGPRIAVLCRHTAVTTGLVVLNDVSVADPAANEQEEVLSSDNTQDKAAGTGALTVGIDYLDQTGAQQHSDVTLNGTTAVGAPGTNYWRVNDFYVRTTGSGKTNVGTITLRKISAGGNRCQINLGCNRAAMGKFTVPLANEMALMGARFTGSLIAGAATPLKVTYQIEAEIDPNDGTYAPGQFTVLHWMTNGLGREVLYSPPHYLVIPALATVRVRAVTEAGTIEVSGGFWGILRSTA